MLKKLKRNTLPESSLNNTSGPGVGKAPSNRVEDNLTPDTGEVKPNISVVEAVKNINNSIGEKGSLDLAPLVDLGRSIWAEGHQTIEAFTARAKELLSDVWDKVKDLIRQVWDTLNNERGSISTKRKYDIDEVNELLDMAGRQDKAAGELSEQPTYDEVRNKAAQMAFEKLQKKIDFQKRKEAAIINPMFSPSASLLRL